MVIQFGLKVAAEWALNIEVAFTDCLEAKKTLERTTNHYNRRIEEIASNIRRSFNLTNINVEIIPREWNTLADQLALVEEERRRSHCIVVGWNFHFG